jgi:hypothetical protein
MIHSEWCLIFDEPKIRKRRGRRVWNFISAMIYVWRCFYYSSKNKTLLALVHCIPCFFVLPQNFAPKPYPKTDYGKFYSGDSYIVLFVSTSLEVGRVAWLIAWLNFIFFRPKKTEAPSAGTFTFGSETRPRRFDTFYFLLLILDTRI